MTNVIEDIRKSYRNNVQLMRLKAGFVKQKSFAERVGISQTTLCDIESNRRFLSSVYGLRISEVLGCKLDDLYIKRHCNDGDS